MKQCPNCAHAAPEYANFCGKCGFTFLRYDFNKKLPPRTILGLTAILLGGLGVHKFMLGKYSLGFFYLLLSFTGISIIIGIIEGTRYLCLSERDYIESECRNY